MINFLKSLFNKPSSETTSSTKEHVKNTEENAKSITINVQVNKDKDTDKGNDKINDRINRTMILHEMDKKYSQNWREDMEKQETWFMPNHKEVRQLIKEKKFDEAFIKCQEVGVQMQVLKTLERTTSTHASYYSVYTEIDRKENLKKSKYNYIYHFLMSTILGIMVNLRELSCPYIAKYYLCVDGILENSFNQTYRNKNYFELFLTETNSIDNLDKIKKEVSDFLKSTFPKELGIDPAYFEQDIPWDKYALEIEVSMREIGLKTEWDWVSPFVSDFVNSLEEKYIN